jgi:hypothetical protein
LDTSPEAATPVPGDPGALSVETDKGPRELQSPHLRAAAAMARTWRESEAEREQPEAEAEPQAETGRIGQNLDRIREGIEQRKADEREAAQAEAERWEYEQSQQRIRAAQEIVAEKSWEMPEAGEPEAETELELELPGR